MEDRVSIEQIEKIARLGTYVTDLTSQTWTGSDGFIKIFGLEKKDYYTTEEFQALVHPDDFEEVMQFFAECLAEKMDFNYQYRCVRSDGKIIHVDSRSQVQYSEEGAPLKIFGVKQDITLQKEYEGELKRLQDLNRKKTDILGIVAHDLRSPMAQIKGVEDLLRDVVPDSEQSLLDMQDRAIQATLEIMEDLIEVAHLESSSDELHLRQMELRPLVTEAMDRASIAAGKKSIRIENEVPEDLRAVIDKSRFKRILDNLISNGLKFSHPDTVIRITGRRDDSFAEISVSDQGIGMPEAFREHLFEMFSRQTRRSGTHGERSTGLGLSIVKQLVDLHGGSIDVESQEGNGTRFTLCFPDREMQPRQ